MAANLDGVHAGCALVDRVLSMVDPVLFNYLESKFLTANIYAFPLVMSLHACVPPLEEAVKLWDAVFSFGVHLEVLVCVAQVWCCLLSVVVSVVVMVLVAVVMVDGGVDGVEGAVVAVGGLSAGELVNVSTMKLLYHVSYK